VRFLVDESLQRHVADLLVITVGTTRIRVRELPIER